MKSKFRIRNFVSFLPKCEKTGTLVGPTFFGFGKYFGQKRVKNRGERREAAETREKSNPEPLCRRRRVSKIRVNIQARCLESRRESNGTIHGNGKHR